jgi:ADP-ribose pyrophosphatase YjhB (NUDIX family)
VLTANARFCSVCGAPVLRRIPPGDTRERDCCDQCSTIHYVNPRPVVGTIPVWGERILLCRRAIEPRYGKWTLPAGFMEIGESTSGGALRETQEEAGARIRMGPLFTMLDVPHVEQVHIFFRAELLDLDFAPGTESLEVQLFDEGEIPWDEIAFRTVSTTLQLFFEDRRAGRFVVHTREIAPIRTASRT